MKKAAGRAWSPPLVPIDAGRPFLDAKRLSRAPVT
jgi:hypothetical protein